MIGYFKYNQKMNRLFSEKMSVRDKFARSIRKAQKEKKSKNDIEALEGQAQFEEIMVDEEIAILASDYLISKAQRSFIQIPLMDLEGMWKKCEIISNRRVLTTAGIATVRSALRCETKERAAMWLPILAALTGIIGSATGLISIAMK